MPLRLTIHVQLGSLEKSESTFTFKHDTYCLLSGRTFYPSPDGQRWASIASPRSLAILFGFGQEKVWFGFVSATNERPSRQCSNREPADSLRAKPGVIAG